MSRHRVITIIVCLWFVLCFVCMYLALAVVTYGLHIARLNRDDPFFDVMYWASLSVTLVTVPLASMILRASINRLRSAIAGKEYPHVKT